jgi:YggT family protein
MIIIDPLFRIAMIAIDLYIWVIIISAILSWLVAFNVLNTSNQMVYTISDFLYRPCGPSGASCPILAGSTFRQSC